MSEYIGNRIVPHHDGVWDKTKEYEPLTIVYEEATGDSYISRKPVPAGTLLSQEKYWAMCSRFSEQMALHRKKTAQDVADITKKVDATNSAVAANKAEMDKTAETLKAQIDAIGFSGIIHNYAIPQCNTSLRFFCQFSGMCD